MTKEKFDCEQISKDRKELEYRISKLVGEFLGKYEGIKVTGTIRTSEDSGGIGTLKYVSGRIETWININI